MSGEGKGALALGRGLFISLVVSLLINFGLGLAVVWVNTGRTGLGYELRELQQRFEQDSILSAKLEIERDRLLSPYYLEQKARELGMKGARSNQIRRLE